MFCQLSSESRVSCVRTSPSNAPRYPKELLKASGLRPFVLLVRTVGFVLLVRTVCFVLLVRTVCFVLLVRTVCFILLVRTVCFVLLVRTVCFVLLVRTVCIPSKTVTGLTAVVEGGRGRQQ